MAGNTAPIYSRVGDIQWAAAVVTTADTGTDGTGANVVLIFTADATNGGRVERIRAMHAGTNVATIIRLFLNNGSTPGTAANNVYMADATSAANTISQVAGSIVAADFSGAPFPMVLPPGYRIYASVGTTIAAGLRVSGVAGKY